ncbi:MAG TPA: alcohol dehydrogenase catalytic domain-containing protein [Acidobacteriota bacterium]|nr:alcohol dehydrogenase catalytic domain-containing protein [Acidobacteriota bacterium]
MKAAWLKNGAIEWRDGLPEPAREEGLELEVLLAGICGTDLQLLRGYAGFEGIPGHEFVARISDPGEVEALLAPRHDHSHGASSRARRARLASPPVGDWERRRVVAEINVPCSECPSPSPACARHCPLRSVVGIRGRQGALAQRMRLPACNLHPVSDHLSDQAAVFCEPLAAALQVQEAVRVAPHESVLVVGAGRLGQLIARVLAPLGCRLRVAAKHPSHVRRLEAQGIEPLSPQDVPVSRFEVVVEATGSPAGLQAALAAVRPRGRIVLKSTYADGAAGRAGGDAEPEPRDPGLAANLDLTQIVVDEIQLVGSRCGPFAPALRLLESGRIDPRDLVDEVVDMDRVAEAFEKASRPGALKILLRPS